MQEVEQANKHDFTNHEPVLVPVFLCEISCGFPSPAEDYIEERLDILAKIVRHL